MTVVIGGGDEVTVGTCSLSDLDDWESYHTNYHLLS